MIIYNITTQVSWSIEDAWKQWLITQYLPLYIVTGLFTHYQVTKLLEVNDDDGPTYAVQLFAGNISQVNDFRKLYLTQFQEEEKLLWGENAISFATTMEVIN
ncbi:MAG: DUF4286 family protein [Flavitalea sp.]